MTPDQATHLATRIAQYWPRGLQTEIWEKRLKRYDYTIALAALDQMADTLKHAPVIADFRSHYRPPETERTQCDHCGGDGWKPVNDDRRHAPRCNNQLDNHPEDDTHRDNPNDCHCHASEPCHCPAGSTVAIAYLRLTNQQPADDRTHT